jgi:hypothetical protein
VIPLPRSPRWRQSWHSRVLPTRHGLHAIYGSATALVVTCSLMNKFWGQWCMGSGRPPYDELICSYFVMISLFAVFWS